MNEIETQDWIEAYKEICQRIKTRIPDIKWTDLWHEQVNFLEEEYPFPSPACFLAFRTDDIESIGNLVQDINCMIDFYLFYETISDSYTGAAGQDIALKFVELMREIHKAFHGRAGEHFSAMTRLGFRPISTGGSGILYQMTFACVIRDYSAQLEDGEELDLDQVGFESEKGSPPSSEDDEPLFSVPMA